MPIMWPIMWHHVMWCCDFLSCDCDYVTLVMWYFLALPSVQDKRKRKKKKRNINNDLAVLPSHDIFDFCWCLLFLDCFVSQLYYGPVVTYYIVYYYTKRMTLVRLLVNKGPAIYVVHLNRYFVIPLWYYLVVTFCDTLIFFSSICTLFLTYTSSIGISVALKLHFNCLKHRLYFSAILRNLMVCFSSSFLFLLELQSHSCNLLEFLYVIVLGIYLSSSVEMFLASCIVRSISLLV